MGDIRKFYLENEHGEQLALAAQGELWLNAVGGLGITAAKGYATVKPGFFVRTDERQAQGVISGTLVFRQQATYKAFQQVTDWIFQAASLKFVYEPYAGSVYYKDVEINSIEKTELKLHRWLECFVSIKELTPWYSLFTHRFSFDTEDGGGYKRYGFRYPYRYAASFTPGSLDFRIEGHYPGEVELIADGPLSAPILTLRGTYTDELYGRLDLSAVAVEEGEMLYFSSRMNDPGVWIIRGTKRVDMIDMVELAAGEEAFFTVPPNTPVTITLAVDGKDSIVATLNILQYYKVR